MHSDCNIFFLTKHGKFFPHLASVVTYAQKNIFSTRHTYPQEEAQKGSHFLFFLPIYSPLPNICPGAEENGTKKRRLWAGPKGDNSASYHQCRVYSAYIEVQYCTYNCCRISKRVVLPIRNALLTCQKVARHIFGTPIQFRRKHT